MPAPPLQTESRRRLARSIYQADPQLHLARVAGGGKGSKFAVGLRAGGQIKRRGIVDGGELGVIEGIESRDAQLNMQALVESYVLDQRKVPILNAGAAKDVGAALPSVPTAGN